MKRYLKLLVLLVITYFFAFYLYDNWNKINEFRCDINWFYLALSSLTLLLTFFLLPVSLRNVVCFFNCDISLKKMSIIFYGSQFAKYLPGGIWGYVGRVYLYRKESMSVINASKSVLLETLLILASGLFVSLCCLCFFDNHLLPNHIPTGHLRAAGIVFFIVLLVVMNPTVLNRFLKVVPKRFKSEDLMFDFHYSALVRPSLCLVAFWMGIGIGFWLLIKSFIQIEPSLLPVTTGAFILSWIIGLMFFFLPAGLGARELGLVALLNLCMPTYISAFIAVASRIWWVIGELIWFTIAYVWDRTSADADKVTLKN
jgi:glycosyltransferase 2 family protein